MNQHEFVKWAQQQHQFVDETFEDAHYPLPRDQGEETIKLHHLDHAIQGVFQSEEVGRRCFYNGDTYKALYKTPNYFPLGWFEACDLYDKWVNYNSCIGVSKEQRKKWSSLGGKAGGKKGGGITGKKMAEKGFSKLMLQKAGRERWISLESGLISNAAGISRHNLDRSKKRKLKAHEYNQIQELSKLQRLLYLAMEI
jgi:hypothetical protein